MRDDFKELIDFVLCEYDIDHSEDDIDNLMFCYGLGYNSKFEEVKEDKEIIVCASCHQIITDPEDLLNTRCGRCGREMK